MSLSLSLSAGAGRAESEKGRSSPVPDQQWSCSCFPVCSWVSQQHIFHLFVRAMAAAALRRPAKSTPGGSANQCWSPNSGPVTEEERDPTSVLEQQFWLKTRQRQRQRFWVHCWLRAIPSVLQVFVEIVFRELMSEWNDVVSRRQRRYERKSQGWKAQSGLRAPEWQCAACKTRSFLSRDTCRGCSKQRDTKQDEYINEWSQTVAWPQQGEYPLEIPLGRRLTLATLAQARAAAMPDACLRILEPVPQVNVSLVRTLEALHTGIIENLWNPDAGQPPEH